ncbi:lipid-A-disaccharide synthase, partial [bacterium]|nr:lipid-A-disaccharide synthase [bacterium]
SGDLHGSYLVRAFNALKTPPEVYAFGGKHLQSEGADLVENTLETSVVGISEVLFALPSLFKRARKIKDFIKTHDLDLVILIDYPGFHLWILPEISRLVPTVYYIPPKVWVWKESRARKILEFCHRVYTIFPFEQRFFPEKSRYFGHPLLDIVKPKLNREEFLLSQGLDPAKRYVGLVPGSRSQEIKKMLPLFLEVSRKLSREENLGFLLPHAPSLDLQEYQNIDPDLESVVRICEGETYSLLGSCDFILATSGTVTLEAAILGTPMLICNRGSALTYLAFQALSKVRHLGLPNILKQEEICPEYLQNDANLENLFNAAKSYLQDASKLEEQKKHLFEVRELLGEPGVLAKISQDMQETYLR